MSRSVDFGSIETLATENLEVSWGPKTSMVIMGG